MTAEAASIPGVSQNPVRARAVGGEIPVRHNPANGYRLFRRLNSDRFVRETARAVRPVKAGRAG